MVLPRASGLSGAFGRTVFRRAGAQARARASRQIGRRTYASDHGGQQSSELPWIIGSVAVTVPAAGWLWSQGPTKGDHGHGHDSHSEEHEEKSEEGGEEPAEEEEPAGEEEAKEEESKEAEPKEAESKEEEPKEEESKDEPKQESKEEESKDEPKEEESKEEESSDEKPKKKTPKEEEQEGDDQPGPNAPGQINWKPGDKKGPGEGQKGERKPSETQAEKNKSSHYSGAAHPYLDDPEKSKKGAGPTETAKIHGTVDTSRTSSR